MKDVPPYCVGMMGISMIKVVRTSSRYTSRLLRWGCGQQQSSLSYQGFVIWWDGCREAGWVGICSLRKARRTGQSQGFLAGGLEGDQVAPVQTLRGYQARVRMKCQCRMSLAFASVSLFVFLEFLSASSSHGLKTYVFHETSRRHCAPAFQDSTSLCSGGVVVIV